MRDYLVTKQAEQVLLASGLSLELTQEEDATSPRDNVDSTFVGGETSIPKHVDKGKCFDDFVKNYCRVIHDCEPSDLVWATVYQYKHTGVTYRLKPFDCPWDSGIAGFIYRTKKELCKQYNVERITESIEKEVMDDFVSELDDYTRWANGEVYKVQISGNDDFLDTHYGDIINTIESVNEVVLDIAQELAVRIDLHHSVAKVDINIDPSALNEDDVPMASIMQQVQSKFGFMPTLGISVIDAKAWTVSVNLAIGSLPSLITVGIENQDTFDIFSAMKNKVKELNSSEQSLTDEEVVEYIINRTNYSDLPDIMIKALISVLFEGHTGVLSVAAGDVLFLKYI